MRYRKYNSRISPEANERLDRRAKTVHRQKLMIALTVILLISVLILLSSGIHAIASSTEDRLDLQCYYTSIKVQPGDTLTGITREYNSGLYESNEDYMEELRALNGLRDDNIISGTSLIVYYYSYEGPES